jgi:hypothetical protein
MNERIRTATCRCGRLKAECKGEPVRVSVCHCLDCQRHRQRLRSPGTLAGKPGHGHRRGEDMGAHCRQRSSRNLPLLPPLRIDRGLRDRRMAGRDCRPAGRFCRSGLSAAPLLRLRASQARVGRDTRRSRQAFIRTERRPDAGKHAVLVWRLELTRAATPTRLF